MSETVHLFSYGTLRDPAVQLGLFGRLITETPDVFTGFTLDEIDIADDTVVGLSGSNRHRLLRRSEDPEDRIDGAVLAITPAELVIADDYETDAYVRIEVTLASYRCAFVYADPGSVAANVVLG